MALRMEQTGLGDELNVCVGQGGEGRTEESDNPEESALWVRVDGGASTETGQGWRAERIEGGNPAGVFH